MTDGLSATLTPRRQWPLWVALALAVVWGGLIVAQMVPGAPAGDVVPIVTALMPPALIVLIIVSMLRAVRPAPDVTALEQRLDRAGDHATRLDQLLRSVDVTLGACAERTERLATAASDDGDGLAASANRLAAAAADVRRSGERAESVTSSLIATMPELERIGRQVEALSGALGDDTEGQLKIIDALLASVQIRGDEVAAQSDAAIASMNKQLAEIDEQSRATTTRIAKRAYALDAAVDGASARSTEMLDGVAVRIAESMATMDDRLSVARAELDAVGAEGAVAIGARLEQLHAAAGALSERFTDCDARTAEMRQVVDAHLAALPERLATTRDDSAAVFEQIGRQTHTVRAGLEALQVPLQAADSGIGTLGSGITRLQQVADQFSASFAAGLPAADEQVGRLETGVAALDQRIAELRASITAGEAATRSVGTLIAGLRVEAGALGAADLAMIEDRMNSAAALMHDIGRQITTYGALSGQTKTTIEADLATLDRQLRAAQADSQTRLTEMSDRVGGLHTAVDDLAMPIGVARRLVGDVEAQVTRADVTATEFGEHLDRQLATAATRFEAMQSRGTALLAETAALRSETDAGGVAIDAVAARFAGERAAFTVASQTLGAEFDRIAAVLAALSADTVQVTSGTADALGQTFARARQLADANAAALRQMLADIVADTEASLDAAGSATAARAFATPIQRELTTIVAAADRASEVAEAAAQRVAGQAKMLGTTIDSVDEKVAEIETRLDVRARDTLSARSARLIDMLNTASVDVARLLSIDVGEQARLRYRKGDLGIFARHTVKLVDRAMNDKIARHFAHDPAFTDEASHYLDVFEKLSRRLESDPDGDALLAAIVSSDLGKLYVAIARATGRWAPAA